MKHAIRIFCTGVLALLFAIPLSAGHKHFKVSVYVRAYEVEQMADSEWLAEEEADIFLEKLSHLREWSGYKD